MSDGLRVLELKTWKEGRSAPCDILRGSAVVHGPTVYCSTTGSKAVYAYDSRSCKWSTLPNCPQQLFALVLTGDTLVAVGGFRGLSPTGALQSLTTGDGESGQSWVETLPQMPTKRGRVAALCEGKHLIVAGGQLAVVGGRLGPGVTIRRTPSPDMDDEAEESGYVKKVEMLDTESEQWYTLASLPHATTDLSISLCQGHLYLLGGWSSQDRTKSVLTCHLQTLLRKAKISLGPSTSSRSSPSQDVWQQAADVPAYGSTSAVLFNTALVAVGGFDDSETPTDEVYGYEPSNDSWHVIGHLSQARYQAVAATLPGNRLMVVGGYNIEYKNTNHVEIGSI